MSDLISREALIEKIEKRIPYMIPHYDGTHSVSAEMMVKFIGEQPTVEAVPVVHGYVKTVVGKMGVMHQECSACGNALEWKAYPNYCDECGAKLDGADIHQRRSRSSTCENERGVMYGKESKMF